MYKLGIDLGGTNIKMVITDETGTIINSLIKPTNAGNGSNYVLRLMVDMTQEITADCQLSVSDLQSAGMGVPGQILGPSGPVLYAPNLHWQNVDPVQHFASALQLPLRLANDADCMALAEDSFGAGKPYSSFLMLVLGTGVGGSVVHNGKLFTGFGPCGGEFGHIPLVHNGHPCGCGLNGCFEQYASASAFKRMAQEAKVPLDPSRKGFGTQIYELADQGNEAAILARDSYVTYLCEGIAGLVNIFRPEAVLLGGGVSCTGKVFIDHVNETLFGLSYASNLIPPPPVLAAELGMFSGAVGASLL